MTNFKFEGPSGRTKQTQLKLITPILVQGRDTNLLELLALFQEHGESVAFVSSKALKVPGLKAEVQSNVIAPPRSMARRASCVVKDRAELIGIVSLKDIFEEIIEAELLDADSHVFSIASGQTGLDGGGLANRLNNQGIELQEAVEEKEYTLNEALLGGK